LLDNGEDKKKYFFNSIQMVKYCALGILSGEEGQKMGCAFATSPQKGYLA